MGLFDFLKRQKKHYNYGRVERREEPKTRGSTQLSEPTLSDQSIRAFEVDQVKSLMSQLHESVNIVNTTTSPRTFWGGLNFSIDVLLELQKYEKLGLFKESTPTQDYNRIINNLEATVDDFVDRVIIAQSNKNELLSTQREKDIRMKKCVENLWNSFYEANDYWQGNNMYPHYTGKLFSDDNFQRVDDMISDISIKVLQNSVASNSLGKREASSDIPSEFYFTVKNQIEFGQDLVVFEDHGGICCGECAKMKGRVYSISGNSKVFPSLPEYAKIHGNFHAGCHCSMSSYFEDSTIYYKGERVDPIKASSRPFVDDRTPEEVQRYLDYIAEREAQKEYEAKKLADKKEYSVLQEKLPNLTPKSFSAYRRMKNGNTIGFQKLKKEAADIGITI